MYQEMIRKCKFHIGHNPWNIKHFEKNVLGDKQYPHKSKYQHNTTKSQKTEKSRIHMQRTIDPQRTATYERPFTHEGNYLVTTVMCT